ncbi:MAG TPA: transcription antitermination factor NusB [Chloroflexi bacterium]|nr:transcription antitermination factor NusB [Chloroflexota bacterium]
MKIRRRARITALQVLFEVDVVEHNPTVALHERMAETPLPPAGESFCREIIQGVLDQKEELDRIIHQIASEWPIEQMAPIDRNILRLASYEILFSSDTPPKVAINEAVDLAKIFGSDSSSRFVNGVLGTLLANRADFLSSLRSTAQEEVELQYQTVPVPDGASEAQGPAHPDQGASPERRTD